MAKHRRTDAGSLLLDPPSSAHCRLWPTFSVTAFRRKLLATMSCGGVSRRRARSPEKIQKKFKKSGGVSEKLSDLLKCDEVSDSSETESEAKRKVEAFEAVRGVVKRLQFEEGLWKKEAAMEVRRLAKDDSEVRSTIAMMGAIPTLVGMIDSVDFEADSEFQIQALYALLNLGIGNDLNKAAIVKAGAIHKMLKLIEFPNTPPSIFEAVVANFLGLSALDTNKPIIGSSGAVAFLSNILMKRDSNLSKQSREDSLRALFNLSISPSNVLQLLESSLVQFLLNSIGDMEISEWLLSILSNVVSTPEGRKALGDAQDAFQILVDVLNWTDSPGCQDKAAYILMVMAHKAWWYRVAMVEAGIVSALLELTLLGSTLAQKRASRILECLRVDKGKQVCGTGRAVSAPLCGGSSSGLESLGQKSELQNTGEDRMMSEERRAVNQLVQQSLQDNMRRIVKRANLPQDFAPSNHFKSLTISSTSKSLPL